MTYLAPHEWIYYFQRFGALHLTAKPSKACRVVPIYMSMNDYATYYILSITMKVRVHFLTPLARPRFFHGSGQWSYHNRCRNMFQSSNILHCRPPSCDFLIRYYCFCRSRALKLTSTDDVWPSPQRHRIGHDDDCHLEYMVGLLVLA